MKSPQQLELRHPVHLRRLVLTECSRIVGQAERQAVDLRARGDARRAAELLEDRRRLAATIERASSYAEPRRRRR